MNPLDDVAGSAGYPADHPPRKGFFTDTSICIGCKACEVACKEWNLIPDSGFDLLGMSYDNTGALGASTWRHVAFIEQEPPAARAPVAVRTHDRASIQRSRDRMAPSQQNRKHPRRRDAGERPRRQT